MKKLVLLFAAAMVLGQNAFAQSRVKNLNTEQNELQVELLADFSKPVQVSRYLFAGYNTLCLPMSLSADQLSKVAAGLKVERLEAIRQEGNTLCLYFVDCTNEGIEAGMPYLIFSPTAQYLRAKNTEVTGFGTDIRTVRMSDDNGNRVSFNSSWSTRQQKGLYGIPAKQDVKILESILIRTEGEYAFHPTRCGFNWEAQSPTASAIVIKHVNSAEVTAIQSAKFETGSSAMYDLQGRRVTKPGKGIVIQNGRKVSVK